MNKYSTTIEIIGINPYVEVPQEILIKIFKAAAKDKGPIPVKGTIQGHPYTQTLVKYKGIWRLYLNTPMRTISNKIVGDRVTIELTYDNSPRTEAINQQLNNALSKNPTAKTAFHKLAPYRQKEINRYLNNLKSEETIQNNIDKVMKHLEGKKIEGVLFYRKQPKTK